MKVGIIIITFNIHPEIFILQIEALRKFCKDDFIIHVVDNSSNEECAETIRYHSSILELDYTRTVPSTKDASGSHSFAANLSYRIFKKDYSCFAYFDHDVLPVLDFSIIDILGEDKVMAGIGQLKDNTIYFWPGMLLWRNDKIDNELIDFSPRHASDDLDGLDTGGNLFKVIERYGKENCIFFNESYHENPYFHDNKYGYYTMINNKTFMHFVGSSNWINLDRHEERINSLLNIAKAYIHETASTTTE